MDEAARKLERRIEAEGDPLARVKLAQERLRAHDPAGALVALGELAPATDPDRLGLEAPARAHALLTLGRSDEAITALRRAVEAKAVFDARAIVALLETVLENAPALRRGRVAAVVGRWSRPSAAARDTDARDGDSLALLRSKLARDPDPLVRLALEVDGAKFDPHWDRSSRVYGSHGADYETGVFVAFEMAHETRIRWFDANLALSVNAALATLAEDAHAIESLELRTAFGEGYGLGGVPRAQDGGAALRACVDRLNALGVLPFQLRASGIRPYDRVDDEVKLARRMAEDLQGHPARQRPYEKASSLVEKIVALHPLSGIPARSEVVAPLLEDARAQVTAVGVRALEIFTRRRRGETAP